MAQTTGQTNSTDAIVEVSTDGSSWTDISGSAAVVTPDGGDRVTGSANTFTGEYPLVAAGKRQAVRVRIRAIYTEVDNESADLINGYVENKTFTYLRYAPRGRTAGNWQFSGQGYFTRPILPPVDAGSGAVVMIETEWYGAAMAQSVIAS